MRMLVLGAGLQGSACAYDLLQHPGVAGVTVADLKPDRIPAFLGSLVGSGSASSSWTCGMPRPCAKRCARTTPC